MVKPIWNNGQRLNHQKFAKKTHPCAKKNMVPRAVLTKSVNAARPMSYLPKIAHSTVKRPIHKKKAFKNNNINQRVNTVSSKKFNTARPKAVVNAVKGNNFNVVKASACWVWKPENKFLDLVSKHNCASVTLKMGNVVTGVSPNQWSLLPNEPGPGSEVLRQRDKVLWMGAFRSGATRWVEPGTRTVGAGAPPTQQDTPTPKPQHNCRRPASAAIARRVSRSTKPPAPLGGPIHGGQEAPRSQIRRGTQEAGAPAHIKLVLHRPTLVDAKRARHTNGTDSGPGRARAAGPNTWGAQAGLYPGLPLARVDPLRTHPNFPYLPDSHSGLRAPLPGTRRTAAARKSLDKAAQPSIRFETSKNEAYSYVKYPNWTGAEPTGRQSRQSPKHEGPQGGSVAEASVVLAVRQMLTTHYRPSAPAILEWDGSCTETTGRASTSSHTTSFKGGQPTHAWTEAGGEWRRRDGGGGGPSPPELQGCNLSGASRRARLDGTQGSARVLRLHRYKVESSAVRPGDSREPLLGMSRVRLRLGYLWDYLR
ncbi:hypothetical protein Tco_0942364 [Tanacetum coccineum]